MDQIVFETHFGNSVLRTTCVQTQTRECWLSREKKWNGVKTELKEGDSWVISVNYQCAALTFMT